jgi:excisionase family DNA binding protein
VNHKTVRRLIASGALPALRVGRVLRIRPRDLDALAYRDGEAGERRRERQRLPVGEFSRRARGVD